MAPKTSKVAILSDIHGNLPALEKALRRARQHTDQIVCLGDVVDGEDADQSCIDLLRSQHILTARGNHDEDFLLQPNAQILTTDARNWLKSLPRWHLLKQEVNNGSLLLIHDSPEHFRPELSDTLLCTAHPVAISAIKYEQDALDAFTKSSFLTESGNIVAIGHAHRPAVYTRKGALPLKPATPTLLPSNCACIINPGTVGGVPRRGGWPNTYGLLDLVERTFTVYRLGNMSRQADQWSDHFKKLAAQQNKL